MAKIVLKLPPLWENHDAEADQKRAVDCEKRISLMATGTKVGKTFGFSTWIVRRALVQAGLHWWTAPYRRTAKIGYNRVISLLPPGKFEKNDTNLSVFFPHNKSLIEFRTAENPDTLYGEGVLSAVVDEGARMREAAWTAINTTMLQTRGPIRIASNTDKGKRNWLYREYLRGLSGDPAIQSFHIRTIDAPHFMEGGTPGPIAIEEMRRALSPTMFAALVLAEFPDDAATVFPGLDKILVDNWNGELLDYSRLPHEFFITPYPGAIFVGGVDLANRRDWTVITVMDAISGLVVYWARFQHVLWAEQLQRIKMVQDMYGCPFLADSTPGSVGDPLLERMQMGGIMVEGFEFKNRTKQWIIEKLAVDIQQQDVHIPRGLKILTGEMEAFERDVSESGVITYHAPDGEGNHDDSVFSLALANWARDNVHDFGHIYEMRDQIRGGNERRGFLGGR